MNSYRGMAKKIKPNAELKFKPSAAKKKKFKLKAK